MKTTAKAVRKRGHKSSKPKSTAARVLEDNEMIVDQMVRHNISLRAFPQAFTERPESFVLDLDIYPDHGGVAHIRMRTQPWEHRPEDKDIMIELAQLEAFAAGVSELVRIAKERGFIVPAQEVT